MIYLDLEPTTITFAIDKIGVKTITDAFLVPVKDEDGNDTEELEPKVRLYYELSGPHPEIEGARLTPETKNIDVDPMIGALLTKALLGNLNEGEKTAINGLLQSFNETFELKK